MAAVVLIIYSLGLYFFFMDERSPIQLWAEENRLISISLFFFLEIIAISALIM